MRSKAFAILRKAWQNRSDIQKGIQSQKTVQPAVQDRALARGLAILLFIVLGFAVQLVAAARATAACSFQSRPIQLGVCGSSARNYCGGCVSGTLGSTVTDTNGIQYILSNNHILALFNTGVKGDDIEQPSCGGTGDTVANLTKYIPLSTSGNNSVDAAIAKVVSGKVNTNNNILGIGPVSQTKGCFQNAPVEKQGAGSGLTAGKVLDCFFTAFITDSRTNIQYTFMNQIEASMTTPLTAGDSGSLLVTQGTPQAVGLVFGSDGGNIAYANLIGSVLSAFNVKMATPTTAASAVSSSAAPTGEAPQGAPSLEELAAEGVVSKYSSDLMKIPGVWGVGVGAYSNGHRYIDVHVEAITPEIRGQVPSTLGGFPVEFTVGSQPHFL